MISVRFEFVRKVHNVSHLLTPQYPLYKQWIFRFTFLELEKDLGDLGDITTRLLFQPTDQRRARLIVCEPGILAGMQEVKYFLVDSDPSFRPRIGIIEVIFYKNDGERVEKNDCILELRGSVFDILAVERVLVNLVGRMSGVATLTRKYLDVMNNPEILLTATRKTIWGLLDKRAVSVVGGYPHRLNLSDAVLVKDNHLALYNGDINFLLENILKVENDVRFIEVEVESLEQALHVAGSVERVRVKEGIIPPFFLLLDNMLPEKIQKTVFELRKSNFYENLFLEASGGINLDNIFEYAKSGVDVISSGSLTTAAKNLDLSLEIF